jgi:hypothetical protein
MRFPSTEVSKSQNLCKRKRIGLHSLTYLPAFQYDWNEAIYAQGMIFRNVPLCSLVDRFQRFGGTCCIHLQDKQDYEDRGKMSSKACCVYSYTKLHGVTSPKTIILATVKIPNQIRLCSSRTAWSV